MSRRTRLLTGVASTVGLTLLLAWVAVQALVLQPAVEEREPLRIQQATEAAALIASGMSKREVERQQGIDLRVMVGPAEGPPEGEGWIRQDTARGPLYKKRGGNHEIAVWSGQVWVVLQSHPRHGVTLALALLAIGLPMTVLVFGVAARAERHQVEAEAQLSRMAAGDLSVRLDEQAGGREVRRVAVAVNRMAAQLEALIAADRERMAGLSHELRTPLTRIRLELELARREGASVPRLDRVERDVEAFDTMLRELLELSRLQMVGEQTLRVELVDLDGLAWMVLDEERWEDVEVRGEGTATVDPRLVARLLRNLLGNSARHAPGARRWVVVEDDALVVGDDGPGIRVDRHADITEAFHRGAGSEGHGLGLAIVARIAALHGAEVGFSAPPGLAVRVRFPRREVEVVGEG